MILSVRHDKSCVLHEELPLHQSMDSSWLYSVLLLAVRLKLIVNCGNFRSNSCISVWLLVTQELLRRRFSLHCIELHFLGPKLVKMTLGCRICHINTKTYVQYNWSFRTRKHSCYTWGYWKIRPYIYIYIYINTVNWCYLHNLQMDESLFRQ
jgi:hypothetical protein